MNSTFFCQINYCYLVCSNSIYLELSLRGGKKKRKLASCKFTVAFVSFQVQRMLSFVKASSLVVKTLVQKFSPQLEWILLKLGNSK